MLQRRKQRAGDTGPLWTPEEEATWLAQMAQEPLEEDDQEDLGDFYFQQLLEADGPDWEYWRDACQDVWEGRRAA